MSEPIAKTQTAGCATLWTRGVLHPVSASSSTPYRCELLIVQPDSATMSTIKKGAPPVDAKQRSAQHLFLAHTRLMQRPWIVRCT
ncbi:MAG: hypothetical protein KDE46_09810, partial [Caldilineaceae bacterium]|nr:hypothetical protein [Caldilineaceae bacterium]